MRSEAPDAWTDGTRAPTGTPICRILRAAAPPAGCSHRWVLTCPQASRRPSPHAHPHPDPHRHRHRRNSANRLTPTIEIIIVFVRPDSHGSTLAGPWGSNKGSSFASPQALGVGDHFAAITEPPLSDVLPQPRTARYWELNVLPFTRGVAPFR